MVADETHLGVRHEDHAAVPSCPADVCEPDARVTRRALDDGPSRLEAASCPQSPDIFEFNTARRTGRRAEALTGPASLRPLRHRAQRGP